MIDESLLAVPYMFLMVMGVPLLTLVPLFVLYKFIIK